MGRDPLSRSVQRILLHDWDPIGIKDEPAAQDEYDSYVGIVAELVRRDSSVDDLFRYLRHLETETIGLPGDVERTRQAARALRAQRV